MLEWLFKKSEFIEIETKFSKLSIGQQFQKIDCYDEKDYIKTDDDKYETVNEWGCCSHWHLVLEDFAVKTIKV